MDKLWYTLITEYYPLVKKKKRPFLVDISSTFHDLVLVFGEGNGTPLQYSRLENPMDRGAWWAAVHGVLKSQTLLSNFTFTFHFHALLKEMTTWLSKSGASYKCIKKVHHLLAISETC